MKEGLDRMRLQGLLVTHAKGLYDGPYAQEEDDYPNGKNGLSESDNVFISGIVDKKGKSIKIKIF